MICRTPGCRKRAGHGVTGLFCRVHAAVLATVRLALATTDGEKYRIYGTRPGYLADDEEVERAA